MTTANLAATVDRMDAIAVRLAELGRQLAVVAALQLAFDLGGARRAFVYDQIDGWHDWNDPGPWRPGYGDSAFAANAGQQR